MITTKKTEFRGKFIKSLCQWLLFNRKTYIFDNNGNDDDNDDDDDTDWDNIGHINGNKPVVTYRRRGLFPLFSNKIILSNSLTL